MPDDKTRLTTTEARGGSGGTQVRTILVVSLALVAAIFAAIFLYYR